MKLKRRIRPGTGRAHEYYLLVKDGDSILYNNWYSLKEMCEFPEACGVQPQPLSERFELIGVKYADIWDAITTPHAKQYITARKTSFKNYNKITPEWLQGVHSKFYTLFDLTHDNSQIEFSEG